jgi:hypothetical protein
VLSGLALIAFHSGLAILGGPSVMGMYRWYSIGLIGVGIVLGLLVVRGFGRPRPPRLRRATTGPDFTADEPEVAGLPPTTVGPLGERLRRARERQKWAQD